MKVSSSKEAQMSSVAPPAVPPVVSPTPAPRPWIAGALSLLAVFLGFLGLPAVAWVLTGEWVPEMLVFGLGACLVAGIAQVR